MAPVKVEYRKTDTPSGPDDDAPIFPGGGTTGSEGGGASSAHSHDVPTEGKEDTGGGKATVHPMKSKTPPEATGPKEEQQEKERHEKSKQGKG